ncbi:LYR motif-containing protein 1, partial [Fasciolopsis buskii]
ASYCSAIFRPLLVRYGTLSPDIRPTRSHVLSLYRRILRLARFWKSSTGSLEDTIAEAAYIRHEAGTLFRLNAGITDEELIKAHIREAESRIELAEHYGTPYPRLANLPPSTMAAHVSRKSAQAVHSDEMADTSRSGQTHISRRTERALRDSMPSYLKSYATWKTQKS